MSNTFHLAILAGDLGPAIEFYCDVLGLKPGNTEAGRWVDIDFWGNELTLHHSEGRLDRERHRVDMGDVCVPHFGAHLKNSVFQSLKQRLIDRGIPFVDKPYRRFVDTTLEQETFFIEDPNGNVLEIKTMANPHLLFEASTSSAQACSE